MRHESMWDRSMIDRGRELGAAEFDWVHWDLAKRNAKAYGKREAIVDTFIGATREKMRRKTWAQFFEDVNLYVLNLHHLGIQKGDMILTQLPNVIENVYSRVATSKLGAMIVPTQIDLGEAEVRGSLEAVDPDITVVIPSHHGREIAKWHLEHQKSHPKLKHIFVLAKPGESVPEGTKPFSELINPDIRKKYGDEDLDRMKPDPFDPWIFLVTGGTTGIPKFCVQSTYTISQLHSAANYSPRGGVKVFDTLLAFGPTNGGTGHVATIEPMMTEAARLIYLTDFKEEDACRITEEEKVTIWAGVPATMVMMATSPYFKKYDMSSVRVCLYSGMPLARDIGELFWDMGIRPAGQYGTSISGACVGGNAVTDTRDELLYTSGKVYSGYDVKLTDVNGNTVAQGEYGEILVWRPHFSYYKDPESTKASFPKAAEEGYGGYEHTGDIGVFDERGNLRIVGRQNDMILRGGANIFPKEIEDILGKHPKVSQIAVVSMPDKILGEKCCAFVVPAPGEKPTLKDLTAYLDELKVTKSKWPERLELIDSMPISTGGKLRREDLRADIAKKLKAEGKV